MKQMSRNLKYFSALTLVFSMVFFYFLFSALESHSYENIWILPLTFGVLMFASGLILGGTDPVQSSRSDLGYQYHLMTFIIVNGVGIPWFLITMGIDNISMSIIALQCLPWGLGLAIHYYCSSKTIKGISKKEIFD